MNLVILAAYVVFVSVVRTDEDISCINWHIRTWTGKPRRVTGDKVKIRFRYDNQKRSTWVTLGSNSKCNFQADQVDVFEVKVLNRFYPPIGLDLKLVGKSPWKCEKIEAVCLRNKGDNFTAMVNTLINNRLQRSFNFSSKTGSNLKHKWVAKFYMSNSPEADTDAEVLVQMRGDNNRNQSRMIPIPAGCDKFKPSTVNVFRVWSEFFEPVKSVAVCLGNNGHLSHVSRDFFFEQLTLYTIEQPGVYTFKNRKRLPTEKGDDCLEMNNPSGTRVIINKGDGGTSGISNKGDDGTSGISNKGDDGTSGIINKGDGGTSGIINKGDGGTSGIINKGDGGTSGKRPDTAKALALPEKDKDTMWAVILIPLGMLLLVGLLFGVVKNKHIFKRSGDHVDQDSQVYNKRKKKKGGKGGTNGQDGEDDEDDDDSDPDIQCNAMLKSIGKSTTV